MLPLNQAPSIGAIHGRAYLHTIEAHAAARWARTVAPLIDAPKDPRTIAEWSRSIAASPAALRNTCRIAGISPRRSLVFGRMLRAAALSEGGQHTPDTLLDVIDGRTLSRLLRLSGLNGGHNFPKDIDEFIERQTLVLDPHALVELRRTLAKRPSPAAGGPARPR
jgi:hypothetical protein